MTDKMAGTDMICEYCEEPDAIAYTELHRLCPSCWELLLDRVAEDYGMIVGS